jgi:hypothetical protein
MAVTYAQVAVKASLHEEITRSARTLVILDEVHHGGDALSWGDAIREAFGPATRRLSLTGTPFRTDTAPIPFVTYAPDEKGIRTSLTDYSYGYGRALADGVVRPVIFLAYAGRMRWRTRMGDEMEARLGEGDTQDVTAQAWRTALDPKGEWMPAVLRAADRRLTEVRHSIPDAGGLVIATDQLQARAYAGLLADITGESVTVVLSDEKASSARIESFAAGESRWMVAVRMVSEGVDVPRLAVGVYATSASTPLYFAQAVGRFVRARRRGETASIFLPTGYYEKASANIPARSIDALSFGKNRWAIAPTVAYTWFNPKTGFEVSASGLVTFSAKNTATDYQTAPEGVLEATVMQHLKSGFAFGLTGYGYKQLGEDSGTGAEALKAATQAASLEAQVFGIGPIITYSTKVGDRSVTLKLKYLSEFDARRRFESDVIAASFSMSF